MPDEVTPLQMLPSPEIIKTPFCIKMRLESKGKPRTKEGLILCFVSFSEDLVFTTTGRIETAHFVPTTENTT